MWQTVFLLNAHDNLYSRVMQKRNWDSKDWVVCLSSFNKQVTEIEWNPGCGPQTSAPAMLHYYGNRRNALWCLSYVVFFLGCTGMSPADLGRHVRWKGMTHCISWKKIIILLSPLRPISCYCISAHVIALCEMGFPESITTLRGTTWHRKPSRREWRFLFPLRSPSLPDQKSESMDF